MRGWYKSSKWARQNVQRRERQTSRFWGCECNSRPS
jgi:hypothetical protein